MTAITKNLNGTKIKYLHNISVITININIVKHKRILFLIKYSMK